MIKNILIYVIMLLGIILLFGIGFYAAFGGLTFHAGFEFMQFVFPFIYWFWSCYFSYLLVHKIKWDIKNYNWKKEHKKNVEESQ